MQNIIKPVIGAASIVAGVVLLAEFVIPFAKIFLGIILIGIGLFLVSTRATSRIIVR